ncbi:hypothetical protein J0J21_23335, partial [Vibrio vulnificus]|uniref:hypothetical protein n=1 Tax=Vibrio vulnificus TaxID=672 RepID=UPI0019D4DEAA
LRGRNRSQELINPYRKIERVILERRRKNKRMDNEGVDAGIYTPDGGVSNENMGMDPMYFRRNGNEVDGR